MVEEQQIIAKILKFLGQMRSVFENPYPEGTKSIERIRSEIRQEFSKSSTLLNDV